MGQYYGPICFEMVFLSQRDLPRLSPSSKESDKSAPDHCALPHGPSQSNASSFDHLSFTGFSLYLHNFEVSVCIINSWEAVSEFPSLTQ